MQNHEIDIPLERNFYGYAGAGPLTVSLYCRADQGEQVRHISERAWKPDSVHIGWGEGGMYLEPHQARALGRFLVVAAAEAGGA